MYRKYFQFIKGFTNCTSLHKSILLGGNYEKYVPKRWAGHSKWQNIKSTKQAMDQARGTAFSKLSRQIAIVVKEKGEDLATNEKLKALWEDAKKINISKSKFENAIKVARNQVTEKPYWIVFSGPKGIILGFEVLFANKNPIFLQNKFLPALKKLKVKLKMEPHFNELCTEKGIIITDPLPNIDSPHEKAMEDAIEIGMEEVFESDNKTLIFECLPDRTESYQLKLESRGYNIISASTELEFKEFINLKDEEIQDLETVISKLKNLHTEIVRASYNALSS